MLAEQQAPVDPRDGGGRAWVERVEPIGAELGSGASAWERREGRAEKPTVQVATRQRFTFLFEVGPLGIAEGGTIYPTAEPFWEWSAVQHFEPGSPGYTTAEIISGEARVVPDALGAGFVVEGSALAAGDRIRFVYGAGEEGAFVDRYAERDATFFFSVDGDGDGYRRFIEGGPRFDIASRDARLLVAHGPAEHRPSETLSIRLAFVDHQGNRTDRLEDGLIPANARFEIGTLPGSTLDFGPPRVFAASSWQDGSTDLALGPVEGSGVLRLGVRGLGPLETFTAKLPPIVVREGARSLVWADLHGHTALSDGTGRPDDYFRYAREVARLDVVSLTDHDHWGIRPLALDSDAIRTVFDTTDGAEEAGRFVTIPGYEWTSWLHGHRHVLYFDAPGAEPRPEIFSAFDVTTDRPDELWDALRDRNALTFAHHSAGDPVAINWRFRPDRDLEPVTEVASVHGQSESMEMPVPVQGGIPGWFVIDTLRAGFRYGFIGSGDSHDGHPGLPQIAGGHGGLAGLFVDGLDRAAVKAALRRRQTFATNGIRPFLEVSIDGVPMGGTLPAGKDEHRLRIRYEATEEIERVELVRSGRVATLEPENPLSVDLERSIPALQPGEFHYVRIRQDDGGNAWSSPIFVGKSR
ncbi:MAG: hypothetical protein CL931_11395 [Deltaproteobacteria bacterium]|nr:hypothetical protein [Deltaproteobacteria bacterium]